MKLPPGSFGDLEIMIVHDNTVIFKTTIGTIIRQLKKGTNSTIKHGNNDTAEMTVIAVLQQFLQACTPSSSSSSHCYTPPLGRGRGNAPSRADQGRATLPQVPVTDHSRGCEDVKIKTRAQIH